MNTLRLVFDKKFFSDFDALMLLCPAVVRELDCLKQRHGGKSPVRAALKWIASCMVRLPSWIHVQSNVETFPVKATPPGSPTTGAFPQYPDLMSPTNEDHVLECALIFAALKAHYGKVALLTRDVALQIKAMAEVMTLGILLVLSCFLFKPGQEFHDRY